MEHVAELLIERARLVGYGLAHAVALIDAELARLGFEPTGQPKMPQAPAGRQAPPRQTAAPAAKAKAARS